MKEEPELPTDDTGNITTLTCQKLYIKEEPPENPDYGKLFDPKIPLMALQGRDLKKEEDADGQHEREVIASNWVLHVKEEQQESTEFGMHYGQKPNLNAIQRIQIKEEPGVETNHQESQSPKKKQKKYFQPTKEGMLENWETSMKSFKMKVDLTKHLWTHTGERSFLCTECLKRFITKSQHKEHQRIHTGEQSHKCLDCGKNFTQKSQLIMHFWIHTGEKTYQCSSCQKRFVDKLQLVAHHQIHTGNCPFKCEVCSCGFHQKITLLKHQQVPQCQGGPAGQHRAIMDEYSMAGKKIFFCGTCRKELKKKSVLVISQRIHTGEEPFPCSMCGQCFRQKMHLTQHQQTCERPSAHVCGACGDHFGRKREMLQHHQGCHPHQAPHTCTTCGKHFNQKLGLTAHHHVHAREKETHSATEGGQLPTTLGGSHACGQNRPTLGRSPTGVGSAHVHTGEQHYPCGDCGKRFSDMSCLTVRQHIHTGDWSPPCPTCVRGFHQKISLVTHCHIHECGRDKEEAKPSSWRRGAP
uniref:C2H2-type domain-containing protein n=1 Tax=Otus sunia TaxID=257818 RepID=A0A8C8BSM4_9STRI